MAPAPTDWLSGIIRLPDEATALLKELGNAEVTSQAIMSCIERDPGLACEVLPMSNSAVASASVNGATSLQDLLFLYSIPSHLFERVFPDDYRA